MTLTARTVPWSQSRAQMAFSGSAPALDLPSLRSKIRRFPINSSESPIISPASSLTFASQHERATSLLGNSDATVVAARQLVSLSSPNCKQNLWYRNFAPCTGAPSVVGRLAADVVTPETQRSRSVIVLLTTVPLYPPLSCVTIKRTPRSNTAERSLGNEKATSTGV